MATRAAAILERTAASGLETERHRRFRRQGILGAGIEHQRERTAPVDADIDDDGPRIDQNRHYGFRT
jgi:hypothetical protein